MASWIEQVPEQKWSSDPALAAQYREVVDPVSGTVDNIMAVHSLNPAALAAHNALYRSAMRGTATLRKVERELIAYVVSMENRCHY